MNPLSRRSEFIRDGFNFAIKIALTYKMTFSIN
jgi:hypothetical protein